MPRQKMDEQFLNYINFFKNKRNELIRSVDKVLTREKSYATLT